MADYHTPHQAPPQYIDHETIILNSKGVWLTNGEEITHLETCKAFAKHLGRDTEGYFIQIGNNHKRIEVEDTPFFVTRIKSTSDAVTLVLNDESTEQLNPQSLSYSPSRLSCTVKKLAPGGPFEARFLPQAYFDLLKDLEQEGEDYFVQIGSSRIKLG
ncbi:MAG: DUF1285 domain-containing protein [Methylotenera sp.]|nr:DUF1285 domain-containing protein [Oligoflexia bacterium]